MPLTLAFHKLVSGWKPRTVSSIFAALAVLGSISALAAEEQSGSTRFDVLVFAPHPDDEVLGCAGVIQQSLAAKKRVGVVVLTSGDGFPKAASIVAKKPQDQLQAEDYRALGAERQRQSLAAMKILSVPKQNLIFLGYPDSGLSAMYKAEGTVPLRQKFTNQDRTYKAEVTDYHSQVHGRPAAYTKRDLLGDLAEIIKASQAQELYATHEVDRHADHRATFWFVRDAAQSAGFRGKFYTYVVHGEQHPELPVHRVALTARQVEIKREAIRPHQIPIVHDSLGSYAKDEELFWLCPLKPKSSK